MDNATKQKYIGSIKEELLQFKVFSTKRLINRIL